MAAGGIVLMNNDSVDNGPNGKLGVSHVILEMSDLGQKPWGNLL